jgi:hypothetical protein
VNRSLLSGRSQQRLIELHRAANQAVQELNQHHSLLIGALLGCDNATQRMMLDEHRAIAGAAVESLLKLGSFLNHCRIAPEAASADPT